MLIQLGLRLLLANVWSKEEEMDKMRLKMGWENNMKSDCCANRDLSPPQHPDKTASLEGSTMF